jgi:hypothetical protein
MHPMTIKKEELKALAKEIRELKRWKKGKPPNESCKNDGPLWGKRLKYRTEHIAYCLVRGRTYEQIERPGEHVKAVDQAYGIQAKILKLRDSLQAQVDEANAEWTRKKAANE